MANAVVKSAPAAATALLQTAVPLQAAMPVRTKVQVLANQATMEAAEAAALLVGTAVATWKWP